MSDPADPNAAPERSREWPLVGRGAELAGIAAARAEGLPGVVLSAPAGVGKSRVAREAVAIAERDGAYATWVRATRSAASVPLGAFAGVVPAQARADDLLALMRGSIETLRERAAGRPLLVAVDDAQLLDAPSAALVLQLVETGAGFVVATVRSGEPPPDAIVSLWKDAGARRMELRQFGERDTTLLVEHFLGGPLEQGALHWLHARSGGNALYVRELVLAALDAGALTAERGLWRLSRQPSVSQTLAELVRERTADLHGDQRHALELLAIGEPLRVEDLLALVGEQSLLDVEARGLVAVSDAAGATGTNRGGTGAAQEVRLAHPLYGDGIRTALGTLRARAVRRQLAQVVQARAPLGPDDALRVARWLLDAGEQVPPALLLDAARAANAAGDPDLGAQLSALAVEGGAGVEAKLLLARAHAVREQFEEAEAVLASAEHELPDEETSFAYLEQRVTLLYWALRRRETLVPLLERADGWWPTASWQRGLDPFKLYAVSATREVFGTQQWESDAVLADPDLDPEQRRQLEPLRISQLLYSGRTREAWELAKRIRGAIPLQGPSEELSRILWSTTAVEAGIEWDALEDQLTVAIAEAVRVDDHVAAGFTAVGIGALRLYAGQVPDAIRWTAEAELQLERRDAFGVLMITRSYQAGAAYAAGDADGVAAAVRRMQDGLGGADPLPNQKPYHDRALAWLTAIDGDRPRAQALLLESANALAETPLYAALMTYEALRLGAPARRLALPLAALAERTDAPLAAAWSAHATARAAGDGGALLEASALLERIGALRYACEAAADAASVFVQAGREDSARRAAARSGELFRRGMGGVAPAIDGLDGAAVALTPREAQLIELAARGLTNAEIADRLVLSVRTVESHIYRAMQKLGVSDRRDLA
ncbi:LuxR family transcriptional regulator [Conexibacter sp. CPCC 206217]|uniref:helix-turn-helix transcriptional regulator n=1 Tax=Conexibacter sp. CPCC 206217 TaxID=3064574 RepID=UPI0027288FBF|nr:LuxR family transcriptional regulator [Conexibacter sp. CPCC 206217]MDO8211758.1 LuxR C-terminal-related transcriptional regulator [Conexibacter sp. CPCC 206217]